MKVGKTAQWLANAKLPHSFTYVPDAAKALVMLTKDATAFGQTWHLPTAANPLTGEQFIELAAGYMNAKWKCLLFRNLCCRYWDCLCAQ